MSNKLELIEYNGQLCWIMPLEVGDTIPPKEILMEVWDEAFEEDRCIVFVPKEEICVENM